MKHLFRLLLIAFFCASGCRSLPEAPGPAKCIAVPRGKTDSLSVDAPFWNTVPGYRLNAVPGYLFRGEVQIKFAYDTEFLYFRFDADDDDLIDEFPKQEKKGGMYLYADAIELFVRPPRSRGYWEFHFIPSGRCGAIHFPARGRRMPSNVRYLPMENFSVKVRLDGTLNRMDDRDRGWCGVAKIPWKGIASRCAMPDLSKGLLIQVTSLAYSVYADGDEKSQLNYIPGKSSDPHHLSAWVPLEFQSWGKQ